MNTSNQSHIFISYSHRGKGPEWKALLLEQLKVFTVQNLIKAWDDERITGGWRWENEIEKAIHNARLAIILLTNEALESEFILERELKPLQEREKNGVIVIPVNCGCEAKEYENHDWIKKLQIRPFEAKPLSTITDDAELKRVLCHLATEIAEELGRSALAQIPSAVQAPGEVREYLDKFPLTRSPSLREEKLTGREQELALLDLAFAQPHTTIISLVAWGGVGKTMLVQHWLQRIQHEGWFGARCVYAWSFYSQGTKEDRQASEDTFLAHALAWFGVQCEPTLSPWDKGRLLADAVARERTLLILDGIEPLQYPPGPMGGQLRAPGMQSLLKQLARNANAEIGNQKSEASHCLCLVTTREPLTDLADFQRREGSPWGSVLRVDLGNLTDEAGATLLHHTGANRAGAAEIKPDDKELLAASREVDGHALTLNLLGRFLARAHGGDIRRRNLVKFEEADRKEQGGTTFKMLAAFENWFARSGEFGARQLAVLRMLGLFDRPADAGCIAALQKPPAIAGLTDPLFTMRLDASTSQAIEQPLLEEDWNTATSFLTDFGLIVAQAVTGDDLRVLDCHPLIREHFARKLREQGLQSWRYAHRRLYEYLATTTCDQPQPTLEDIQPLYHAIAHACSAGLPEEARSTIYFNRILRRQEHHSWHQLGAFGAELSVQASFFDRPWSQPASELPDFAKVWVLSETACCLRAVGRSTEALQPLTTAFIKYVALEDWANAASAATNLGELEAVLGELASSVDHMRQAVNFIDRERSHSYLNPQQTEILQIACRAALAYSLHQEGKEREARDSFKEAEALQAMYQPSYPFLRLWKGFVYCDLILGKTERFGWKCCLNTESLRCSAENSLNFDLDSETAAQLLGAVEEVEERAANALHIAKRLKSVVAIGLDHLALGRAYLLMAIHVVSSSSRSYYLKTARTELELALDRLRRGGTADYIPLAILSQAWARSLECDSVGAQADLDEAWDIADRGPMRLHLADIHLHRARLFFREKHYPWKSPQDDLAAAEKLISDCGYHRRDEELVDAKRAIFSNT